jgi:hypothetical protein
VISKKMGWTPDEIVFTHTKVSGPLLSDDGRFSVEAFKVMQDTLLEEKVLQKRLPLDEHYTTEFTPVRV